MKKLANHTPVALFVGAQALVIQAMDQVLHTALPPVGNTGFSWVSFLAWATYFMAGCTVLNGVRSFFGFIIGIVASIVIFELGGMLGALGFFAVPVAVFIIAWLLFYLELAPNLFSFVPAVYISAGTFFGCMNYVPGATYGNIFLTEMVYLTLGLIFGWMTIAFRGWYDQKKK